MRDAQEHDPSTGQAAQPEEKSRFPRLIPLRIYELTHRALEHAANAELVDLTVLNLNESIVTCDLVADQCTALVYCMLSGRLPSWPPAEEDLRLIAAAITAGVKSSGEKIAHTGPPSATYDAIYTYLSRVVVDGEPSVLVFPFGEFFMVPVWITAAMLVSNAAQRPWQAHLDLIWELETEDGFNYSALVAMESRNRRRRFQVVREPE